MQDIPALRFKINLCFAVNTSLVLEESLIGVDRLPVVDDSLSTPLVEHAPTQQHQLHEALMNSYVNSCNEYVGRTHLPADIPTVVHVTRPDLSSCESEFSEEVTAKRAPSSMSVDSTISDSVTVDAHLPLLDPLEQEFTSPPHQDVSPAASVSCSVLHHNTSGTFDRAL